MGKEADSSNHDRHLTRFLKVIRQHSLKLNLDKLQFETKQASFGTTPMSDGHKPEDDTVKFINNMP